MKKTIALFLIFGMLLCLLTSCVEPEVRETEPGTESPTTGSAEPSEQPNAPTEEPTESVIEPTESVVEPTDSEVEPTESAIEPTESDPEPTDSEIEPTESEIEPTESEAEPTESEIEPTESVIEPTDSEVKPTDSEIEPTESEPSDSTESEPTVPPLPDLPSDYKELEMLYRKAHGLEDDEVFAAYEKSKLGQVPLPALISADHLSLGMTRGDVCDMIPTYARLWDFSTYLRYSTGGQPWVAIFFVDSEGRYVVLELDLEERIEKITVYDEVKTSVTPEDILAIRTGDTIYDVIEKAGFPRHGAGNYLYTFADQGYTCISFTDLHDDNLQVCISAKEFCGVDHYPVSRITVDPPEWLIERSSSKGLEYTAVDGGWMVSGIGSCTDTQIEIPAVYQGLPVISIGEKAFFENTSITDVTLPKTIASIGANAFSGCTELTTVTLTEEIALSSIGAYAFSDCTKLTSVNLTEALALSSVGAYAFSGCTALEQLRFPTGIERIEDGMFLGCKRLRSFTIPAGVTRIGAYAFSETTSLLRVRIPESVIRIEVHAFHKSYVYEAVFEVAEGWKQYYGEMSYVTLEESVLSDTVSAGSCLSAYGNCVWIRE